MVFSWRSRYCILPEILGDRVEYTLQSVVCRAEIQGQSGFIMDSSYDRAFCDFLFVNMEKGSRLRDDADGVLEFNSGVFEARNTATVGSAV